MAGVEPYTSTYTDVDGSIMDATDLVNEFHRVAYFLALWNGVINQISNDTDLEENVTIVEGNLAEILPARGFIQRIEVAASVVEFEVAVREHTEGAPFRVFTIIRCANKATRFKVTSPAGDSHIFGLNRSIYLPSQRIADGFYTAAIICTYGAEEGVMVQVFASNDEEENVDKTDILQLVAQ